MINLAEFAHFNFNIRYQTLFKSKQTTFSTWCVCGNVLRKQMFIERPCKTFVLKGVLLI